MKQNRKDPPEAFASPTFDTADASFDISFDDDNQGNRPEHVPCDMPLSPTQIEALFDEEEDAAGKIKKKSANIFRPTELHPPEPPSMFFADGDAWDDDDWAVSKPDPNKGRGFLELAPGDEDAPSPFDQIPDDVDWSSTNIKKSPYFSKFGPSKMKGWSDQSQASATTATDADQIRKNARGLLHRADSLPPISAVNPSSPAPATSTATFSSPLRAEANDRNVGNIRPSPSRGREPANPLPPPMEAPITIDREMSNSPVLFHETEATVVQNVEATLITSQPSMPVYDAVAMDNEDDELPWWKRYGKVMFLVLALTLIIGALIGVVLSLTLDLEPRGEEPLPVPVQSPQSSQTSSPSSITLSTNPPSGPKDVELQTPSPTSTSTSVAARDCSVIISQQLRSGSSSALRMPISGCIGYYVCVGFGEPAEIMCPAGTMYDAKLKECARSNSVQCESTKNPTDLPTKQPTEAPAPSTTTGKVPGSIFLPNPAASEKPTMSPTLRPSTAKPSPLPTRSPTTESPMSSDTTPELTPFPTKLEVPEATPRPTTKKPTPNPTPKPITFAPTTRQPTLKPTPRPITPSPTTRQPTANPNPDPTTTQPTSRPTPNPTTRQPTTRQPTKRPTPEPTTRQPTKRPTSEPTTSQPTPRPTPEPTTRQPTKRPSPEPTTRQPTPRPTPKPTTIQPTKMPTQEPTTRKPTLIPSSTPTEATPEPSLLNIALRTDQWGEETSWSLYSVNEESDKNDAQISLIEAVEENTYAPNGDYSADLILHPGKYRFTLKDSHGDGFCCSNGSEGWYKISLDDREIISGDHYTDEISYDIVVGYSPEKSARDDEWLEAHNIRRQVWHEHYGETYMPLLWSKELADSAYSWAEELVNDCTIKSDNTIDEGQNIALNIFNSQYPDPADKILVRWVDNKESFGYPSNGALTQVLWRASRYVGCGDAVKINDGEKPCHIHVCRYVRAGNCNMKSYNASEGDNWLVPMLIEHTPCGPDCPPGGCF